MSALDYFTIPDVISFLIALVIYDAIGFILGRIRSAIERKRGQQ
jgi:tetrahydromethanopterin S-methyltransferase subunit C